VPRRIAHQVFELPFPAPPEEREMARVHVRLAHGPRSGIGHRVGRKLHGTPRIAQQAVRIVDRLAVVRPIRRVRPAQEHRERAGKGLDVVFHITEGLPNGRCGVSFAAETTGKAF